MRTFVARIIVTVGLLFGCSSAALATLVYTINVPNAALGGFPPPYATATVTLIDATHADIVFQSLNNYLIGGAQALDLNVGATGFTVNPDPVTAATLPGFTTPDCGGPTAGNVSSFGSFNLTMDCFDGYPNAGTTFSFELTNTSGTWLTEADILVANASGFFAAAHIFVCDGPCDPAVPALTTGFAGNSEGGFPPVIPEPQPLALVGLGLLVLGIARRRG